MKKKTAKTGRIVGLIAIAVLIFGVIIAAAAKPSMADQVWVPEMVVGNPEAKNHYIVYTDLVCPYCLAFDNTLIENQEEFKKYIEENDIYVEFRVTDYLYEAYNSKHSRYSAVAAYCAKNEGKFWDFYDAAVPTVWNEYFKANGKAGGSMMSDLDESYWTEIGKKVGLGDEFESCVKNQDTLGEVQNYTQKTLNSEAKGGMPYFKFNKFAISGGFDLTHGWKEAKALFDMGLKNK